MKSNFLFLTIALLFTGQAFTIPSNTTWQEFVNITNKSINIYGVNDPEGKIPYTKLNRGPIAPGDSIQIKAPIKLYNQTPEFDTKTFYFHDAKDDKALGYLTVSRSVHGGTDTISMELAPYGHEGQAWQSTKLSADGPRAAMQWNIVVKVKGTDLSQSYFELKRSE